MTLISDHEAARRLARTIISDITIYNKEKVEEGLINDNIFDLMAKELEQGRRVYFSRVDPEIIKNNNYYDLAIVDVMIQQIKNVKCNI